MDKLIKITALIFSMICSLSCSTNTIDNQSEICGKYFELKDAKIRLDTVGVFDPIEFKESKIILKTYVDTEFRIVCRDTLEHYGYVFEYGYLKNSDKLFLIRKQKAEYYPYIYEHGTELF